MLDRYFGNVCELDLVFNFHKAYTVRQSYRERERSGLSIAELTPPTPPYSFPTFSQILDEFIIAGELQETSQVVMLDRLKDLEKIMM